MYSEATLFNKQYHNIRVYRTKRNTFLGEIILWNVPTGREKSLYQ